MESTYPEAIYNSICRLAKVCRGEVTPFSIGEAFDTVIFLAKRCDNAEALTVQECATITWHNRAQVDTYSLKQAQSPLESLALLAADIVVHEPVHDASCKCLIIDEIANVEPCRANTTERPTIMVL